jgi:hypothetical protein
MTDDDEEELESKRRLENVDENLVSDIRKQHASPELRAPSARTLHHFRPERPCPITQPTRCYLMRVLDASADSPFWKIRAAAPVRKEAVKLLMRVCQEY